MTTVNYVLALLLAFVFTVVLFCVEGSYIFPKLTHQYTSKTYPNVIGRVTKSEVAQLTSRKNGLTMATYVMDIGYQYEVGGKLYDANCFRYNNLTLWANSTSSSSAIANSEWAQNIASSHPVGSRIQVFYNPNAPSDALLMPGINGDDLIVVLALTPFNMAMLGLWVFSISGLRRMLLKPIAGGVEIQDVGWLIHIRLSRFSPSLVAIAVVFCLSFIVLLVVKNNNPEGHPAFGIAIKALCTVFGLGILVYLWGWQKIRSGDYDLIIDESAGTVCMPKTLFGRRRVTIAFSELSAVTIEVHKQPRGGGVYSYSYAPTLRLHNKESQALKLADWRERDRAEAFAAWLRKRLKL